MFANARIKLTAWYLIILMAVSFLFSGVIYRVITLELQQGLAQAERRLTNRGVTLGIAPHVWQSMLVEDYENAQDRVIHGLLMTNAVILGFAAIASYMLAGKSLRPIQMALEEQKRFITDASHELHTPLTALKTSIEVALRDKKLTLAESKRVLASNLDDIDALSALTENLLSLSRLEKNGHAISFTRVDLADIIQTVLKRLEPLIKKKNITLEAQLQNIVLAADESGLSKLVTILVDNAIKYTPHRGSVRIIMSSKRNKVYIRVTDTGVGISQKDKDHIFERFYRADTVRTKTKTSGFGLGLPIAKRIVDLHAGSISVESKVGKGTTFTITLPNK